MTMTHSETGTATVRAAQRRLDGRVTFTPVVRSDELDLRAGARLWLKAENLQRGGSFKLRGALLAVERLVGAGSRGLVAHSTGNHAIAVALAAAELGRPAVMVLPHDVVPRKAERILATGAKVVLVGGGLAERVRVAEAIADAQGFDLVDPYEDRDVVAGHGTAIAELLDQMAAAGARPAAVVIPVGGGSALAGACLAVRDHDSQRWADRGFDGAGIDVVGAEPATVDSLTQALRAGRPVTVAARPTIADGLRPDRVGDLPFRICREEGARVRVASEDEIALALRVTLLDAKQLVEPSAATAVAVALGLAEEDPRLRGGDIGVLLSGGNVGMSVIASLLDETDAVTDRAGRVA
jgi:threo-3-hydroxy-L-aspartate ammonia-lyase